MHTVRLTAVVADVAQRSACLQEDLLVGGVEELDEWRDEAGFHARGPHELWRREEEVNARSHNLKASGLAEPRPDHNVAISHWNICFENS